MQKAIENNKEKRIAMKGRGKRKIKNFMISLLALTMVMTTLQSSAWAGGEYTTESSLRNNTGIQDLRAYFERASVYTHSLRSVSIAAKIPSAYKQNIFHYECPESGYYAIYATPGIDTVGALFEEQNYWFKQAEYELVAHNDDQYKGFGTFGIVARLDRNEDYYACVRGYGKTTGAYNLVIEPNVDKVPLGYRDYGVWNMTYYPEADNTDFITKKVYLNKEQTILFWKSMDSHYRFTDGKKEYTVEQLQQLYTSGEVSRVCNIVTTSAAGLVGLSYAGSPLVGLTASFIGLMFTEILTGFINSGTKESVRKKVGEICGISYYDIPGSGGDSRYVAKHGLLAISGRAVIVPWILYSDAWGYHPYDPGVEQMKGKQWYVGEWSFE